jgi:hypothetical protein
MKELIFYSIKMISLILLVRIYLIYRKIHAISGLTTLKGFQIVGGIKQEKSLIIYYQI